MLSLDSEVFMQGIVPGFIKVDVSDCGLEVVKGAIKAIMRFRPVLSLYIYITA